MYEDIFSLFNKNRIKYVVVGGIAVNLQGAMRSTADLDIVVELTAGNIDKLFKACDELGYKLKQPIKPCDIYEDTRRTALIKDKALKAITFCKPKSFEEIDVLVDLMIPFKRMHKNADICKIGSLKVRLASIDDLIKMKSAVLRPLDKMDIQTLKEIKKIRKKGLE